MDQHHCLKIARRVNTLLTEALGSGIDAQRMVAEPLYARDVLLVCQGVGSPELVKLNRMFRQAILDASTAPPQHEPLSISSMLSTFFGAGHHSTHRSQPSRSARAR